jgi:hypothetical protein
MIKEVKDKIIQWFGHVKRMAINKWVWNYT